MGYQKMASKKKVLPLDANVENVLINGVIASSTAKLTKKNDIVHIKSTDGMFIPGNDYKTVTVTGKIKGNDVILFDDVNDIDNLVFKQVTGTKNLQIAVKDGDTTIQDVIIKNFFKKTNGMTLASSVKTVQINDDNKTAFDIKNLIDYAGIITRSKKGVYTGSAFNDNIAGSIKNDTIKAGSGNDVIYADLGNDSIYGGAGSDKFIFDTYLKENKITSVVEYYGSGKDTICDASSVDVIEFRSSGVEQIYFKQSKKNLVITYYDISDKNKSTKENTVIIKNYFKTKYEKRVVDVVAQDENGNLKHYSLHDMGLYDGTQKIDQAGMALLRETIETERKRQADELEAAKTEAYEKHSQLVKELSDTKSQLSAKEAERAAAQFNYETAQANYEQACDDLTAYQTSHTKTNEEYAILLSQKNTAQSNYETALANYEQAAADLAFCLENQSKSDEDYQNLLREKNAAQSNYETAQANYEQACDDLTAYQTSHTKTNEEYATLLAQKNTAQSNYETAQANYEAKSAALTAYQANHTNTDEEYQTLLAAKNIAEQNLETYQATYTKTTAEYNALVSQKESLENQLQQAQSDLLTYQNSHTHTNTEYNNLSDKIEDLQTQLDEYEAKEQDVENNTHIYSVETNGESSTFVKVGDTAFDDILVFEKSTFKNSVFLRDGNNLIIKYFNETDSGKETEYGTLTIEDYFTTPQNARVDRFVDKYGITHSLSDAECAGLYYGNSENTNLSGTNLDDIFIVTDGNCVINSSSGSDILKFNEEQTISYTKNLNDLIITFNNGTVTLPNYFSIQGHSVKNIQNGANLININSDIASNILNITGKDLDNNIVGTDGKNYIKQSNGNICNSIIGKSGDDTIENFGTANYIFGDDTESGTGKDIITSYGTVNNDILGGDGNDTITIAEYGIVNGAIYGGAGNDTIYGGKKALTSDSGDTIYGGDGDDIIYGGPDDTTFSGTDWDTIYGEAGNDTIYGGVGCDTIYGGTGNDEIHGGYNSDTLYGNEGNDIIYGDELNDNIDGGDGNDQIYGGIGNDRFTCSNGNDTYYFTTGDGQDLMITSSTTTGIDKIKFTDVNFANITVTKDGNDLILSCSENDKITLRNEYTNACDITVIGTDNVRKSILNMYTTTINIATSGQSTQGTPFADRITGSTNGNDTIYGNNGNDDIRVYKGTNRVYGGAGNDIIRGGAGNIYAEGGDGDDTITGGSGAVDGYSTNSTCTLIGGMGNDTISGKTMDSDKTSQNVIYGDLTLEQDPEQIIGGDDVLDGEFSTGNIYGGGGNDIISPCSGSGANVWSNNVTFNMYGGGGNDTINLKISGAYVYAYGGIGNDTYNILSISDLQDRHTYDIIEDTYEENSYDIINVNMNKSAFSLYMDITINNNGNITNGTNLYLNKSGLFGNKTKGVVVVTDEFVTGKAIEEINTKDGYTINFDALSQIRQDVAGWLATTAYKSTDAVISSNKTDLINEMSVVFNNSSYWTQQQ